MALPSPAEESSSKDVECPLSDEEESQSWLCKVLVAPSVRDPLLSLDQFAAESEAAGMKISTSKSEAVVFGRKKVKRLLCVGKEILPQVAKVLHLRVLFTSEERLEQIDRRIGGTSEVMWTLRQSVVLKMKLS